ncbi:hypothetical protein LY78DRAFT_60141 [Colletotrichum sublineola]|nr:hypothetical protein LY78DRAFT_60141 [Colletotrichum sublineola]
MLFQRGATKQRGAALGDVQMKETNRLVPSWLQNTRWRRGLLAPLASRLCSLLCCAWRYDRRAGFLHVLYIRMYVPPFVHPLTICGRHALYDGVRQIGNPPGRLLCLPLSDSRHCSSLGAEERGGGGAIWCSWLRGDEGGEGRGGEGRERRRLESLTEPPAGPVNPSWRWTIFSCLGNGFAPAGGGDEKWRRPALEAKSAATSPATGYFYRRGGRLGVGRIR